jgi:hypothetical protein
LRRKYWSVVLLLCPQEWRHTPQVKSANLSLKMQVGVRGKTAQGEQVFRGKEALQKITCSTVWVVQLKSGDN